MLKREEKKLSKEEKKQIARELTTGLAGYGMAGCATYVVSELITEILPAPVKMSAKIIRHAGEGVIFMIIEDKCVEIAENAYDDMTERLEAAKKKAAEKAKLKAEKKKEKEDIKADMQTA